MKRLLSLVVAIAFTIILSSYLTFGEDKSDPPKMGPPPTIMKKESPPAKTELLDINTATEVQLKALPGITDDHIKSIIENRPYSNKEELKVKGIIPDTVYELIKDRITARLKAER
jgi:DNA uptake protein ComE-like DNA-binding protein